MEYTRKDLENALYERWVVAEDRSIIEEELKTLLIQHANAVMFSVLRRADEAAAGEAATEVLMALPSFAGESLFTTWAHRIILRTMYYQRRLDRRRKETTLDILGFDLPANPTMDLTDLLMSVQKLLSEESYKLFRLLVLEGYSQSEVATQLQVSQAVVSREWAKIARVLRNAFGKHVQGRGRPGVRDCGQRAYAAVSASQ